VRLIRHLNEQNVGKKIVDNIRRRRTAYDDEAEKIAKVLLKDCLPAIKEMRLAGRVLWRGIYGTSNRMRKHTTRKDRRPKDANPLLHKLMDKILGNKFGWFPRSNSAICSNSYGIASDYGFPRAIFPIGRYKCIWARGVADTLDVHPHWIVDTDRFPQQAITAYMFSDERKTYGDLGSTTTPIEDQIEKLEKIVEKVMTEKLKVFKQTGLKEPLSHGQPIEIMVGCKEYYSVESNLMNLVVGELRIRADNL
jgi:hypothetical protein